jgi:hypothetical protein
MGAGVNLYYDRQGRSITREAAWLLMEDPEARRVALTRIEPGIVVSTAHIVLNHQFDDGPPLIFETMIWRDEILAGDGKPAHDWGEQWRYPTEEAALAGHDQAVKMIEDSLMRARRDS